MSATCCGSTPALESSRQQDYVNQSQTLGVRDRTAGVRALTFGQDLAALAQKGDVLHDDGRIVVFRIKD